jgi:hypothetical protein
MIKRLVMCGGVLAVALGLSSGPATAVVTNGVNIAGTKVPGGSGKSILVSIVYQCLPAGGVKHLSVTADERDPPSSGANRSTVPVCDSASHAVDVAVGSSNSYTFSHHEQVTITASLLDAMNRVVDHASETKTVTAA